MAISRTDALRFPPARPNHPIAARRADLTAITVRPDHWLVRVRNARPPWSVSIAVLIAAAVIAWTLAARQPSNDAERVVTVSLAAAEEAFAAGRLTEPSERSALHYYSLVLMLDPLNEAARRGVDRIIEQHAAGARTAIESGRLAEAAMALETIRRLRPEHPRLALLNARLREALDRIAALHVDASEPAVETLRQDASTGAPAPRAAPAATDVRPPEGAPAASARRIARAALPEAPDTSTTQPTAASGSADPEVVAHDDLQRAIREAMQAGSAPTIAELPRPAAALPREVSHYVAPTYPRAARLRGVEGWVEVAFRVTASGDVLDVRVQESQPERLFDRATLAAVRQWRYAPSAAAADERIQLRIAFELED